MSNHYLLLSTRLRSRPQRGFALLVALIFLLLITFLAVGAAQRSLLQQRMAGSLRNAQQARMSAETALRGAEYQIWLKAAGAGLHCQEGNISSDDGCIVYRPQSRPYAAGGKVRIFRTATGWVTGIGKRYSGPQRRGYTRDLGQPTSVLAYDPVYLIEDLGRERPPGTGGLHESGNTGPNNGDADELDLHIYRITARGAGGNPNVVSVVQSTFDAPSGR